MRTLVNTVVGLVILAFVSVLPALAQDLDLGADVAVIEGNSLSVSATLANNPIVASGTVDYQVQAATCAGSVNNATPGDDFVVASGTLTFPAGAAVGATQSFTVQTVEDAIRENPTQAKTSSECFQVSLSNFSAAFNSIINGAKVITITDDEDDRTLSVSDASIAENAGSAEVVVTLSGAMDEAIDLDAAASFINLTAESADYDATSDVGEIAASATSGTLFVPITNDAVYEGTETFNVQIAASTQYSLSDGIGKVTITDDEGVPELSINDASAAEGANVAFTITKSHAAEAAYNISLSYADVTATSVSDYTPVTNVAVAAGDATTETVNVAAVDDSDVESTESFIVSIVDGADYDVDNGNGLGTITDNDGTDLAVTVALGADTIDLSATPSTSATITITNNGAQTPANDVTVTFSDSGFLFQNSGTSPIGLTQTPAAPATGDRCDVNGDMGDGSCRIDKSLLASGSSVSITITTLVPDGAAGTTASLTVSVSDADDTDVSNDAASDAATLVGLDFGNVANATANSFDDTDYHRISGNLALGTAPDAETAIDTSDEADGVKTLFGGGAGLVRFAGGAGTVTNYLQVTVAGLADGESAYVSVLTQRSDDFESVLNQQVTSNGINYIPIAVKNTANGTAYARVRICDTSGECDAFGDDAGEGEVEDYTFSVAAYDAAAPAAITIPEGVVEPVTVKIDGANLVLEDGNGVTIHSAAEPTGGTLSITGNSGPNTFVVDVDGMGAYTIAFDGEGGSDALELDDSGGTSFTTVTHGFTNASDGSVTLSNTSTVITYEEFEPILDNLSAVNRVMTFAGSDDNIVLRDNGSSVDGMTFIDSNNSEQVTFANPTTSLTINAGAGDDTIDYDGVDETAPNNTFSITFNGDSGADLFTILPTPVASSLGALTVAGGTPAVCPGDVLDIDTSGGAVIDNLTPTPVTFTGASHDAIAFSGIEAFADQSADVAISATSTAGTDLNAGDITTITLSVTNNGPDTASCVMVNDILLNGAFTLNSGPTFSVGSFTSPKWTIGSLASGDTATLTYTVTVGQTFNGAAAISVNSPESDPDESNNSVTFNIEPAFPFPVKAQATAAAWFGSGANEHLVVGLANGFAGLNSSVLCRVPPATGFPENLWRECGNGLPYPLYVNDLYLDDQGTPADSSDDKLYLASWGSAGLYVSEDGGENFTAAEPDLGDHGGTGWTNVYAIVEDVDGFLYISTNHGFVYRSLNNGATWQKIGDLPEVDADTPWSLAAHPTENGRLYAGTFGRGVYTSDDYGFTWSFLGGAAVNQLLIADNGGHIFDLELTPSSNAAGGFIFAATGGGVFRMAVDGDGDSAGLWDMLDTDVTLNSGTVTPEARALAFDMSEDLYVTTWGHGAFFSAAPTVATSMTQIVLRGANVSFVAVNPAGDQVIFGTETQGVLIMPVASSTDTEPIAGEETTLPSGYVLNQNYPNPFNPVTTISFALPETGQVRLSVYDVLGREVKVLVNGTAQAGQHEVQFDAAGLPTGTYIYRLETDKGSFAKQLVLMK